MHTAAIKRVSSDAVGRLALTVSYDETARIWEVSTGRLIWVLRVPIGDGVEGMLYCGALSPDGSLVAVGGYTGRNNSRENAIYLFDHATGRQVRRIGELPNVVLDLAFSAQGLYLAAVLGNGNGLSEDSPQE
jgi:WD40 repeat protein